MNTLFLEGLNLMLVGMGFVFTFLTLLVFATSAMSWAVSRFAPEPEVTPTPRAQAVPAATSTPNNNELIGVIAAAIRKYRDDQQNH